MAVLVGVAFGSVVNMGIIMLSGSIIPPPEGGDVTTTEGLRATMHLFGPQHYIMPFLAHALGTLAGALVAALIAATHRMAFSLTIGAFFLMGGTFMVFELPAPLWFEVLDLTVAYLPMAYLGWWLAARGK